LMNHRPLAKTRLAPAYGSPARAGIKAGALGVPSPVTLSHPGAVRSEVSAPSITGPLEPGAVELMDRKRVSIPEDVSKFRNTALGVAGSVTSTIAPVFGLAAAIEYRAGFTKPNGFFPKAKRASLASASTPANRGDERLVPPTLRSQYSSCFDNT